jgi:small subunit ribosomal protein S20
MPITSSAKKAMRQANARTARRKPFKTRLKTELKKVLLLVKTDPAAAKKAMPELYSVIDTAAKKNMIHKNNANRKKSRLAKALATAEGKGKK